MFVIMFKNLALLKHLAHFYGMIDLWDENVMPEHENGVNNNTKKRCFHSVQLEVMDVGCGV